MDGSCLASPRWVSLLVAEIYYPDVSFPNPGTPSQNRNPVKGASPPNVSVPLQINNENKNRLFWLEKVFVIK